MSTANVKTRMTGSGTRLILVTVAAGCIGLLLTLPRAVVPTAPPALVFAGGALEDAETRDRELAANVPSSPEVDAFVALIEAQSRAEVGDGEQEDAFLARQGELDRAAAAVEQAHGEAAFDSLRASAMSRLDDAMNGRLAPDDEEAVLGSFPRMLARYGVTDEGELRAPWLVVRALFAGRWNALARRELTAGLSNDERAAYWGWLALGSPDAPAEMRVRGMSEFARAGGRHAVEAAAFAAFRRGEMAHAASLYRRAAELSGSSRLRNYSLACLSLVE